MSEGRFGSLADDIRELMEETGVPGVAVGVQHDGEEQTAGFGVTSVENPLPVTDETLFQIGSITKTYTALIILHLVEEGKLGLDAPVRDYLPEFRVQDKMATTGVTLRHLLTHTAGWVGDFFVDTGAGDDAAGKYVAAMADLEQLAPLGTRYSYNNAGFYLAGAIIEAVTGKSYRQVLRELVLEPLQLHHTFLDPGDVMTHRFVVGHEIDDEAGAQVARPWALARALYPVGGLVCDVQDLLRYARFQLGDGATAAGERLLRPETLSLMHTAQVTAAADRESVGLAWHIRTTDELRLISHGGGTKGQISLLLFVPEHHFALALLTNGSRGGRITQEVQRRALETFLGVALPEPQPVEASAETLLAYAGTYSRPFADVELRMENGQLVAYVTYKEGFPAREVPPAPAPPPMAVAPCGDERLLVLDGPWQDTQMEIIRRPDGTIGWLRTSRLHRRVDG